MTDLVLPTIDLIETRTALPEIIGQLPRDGGSRWSSIGRRPVPVPKILLTSMGLRGDQCTETALKDPDNPGAGQIHGGFDKAVYVYVLEHYDTWRREIGGRLGDRSFGENWVIYGADETTVRIGDVWKLGEAELVVTKPRIPCGTLNAYFGPGLNMSRLMTELGLCGWYMGVRQPGLINTTGTIQVIEQNLGAPTIARVFAAHMHPAAAHA